MSAPVLTDEEMAAPAPRVLTDEEMAAGAPSAKASVDWNTGEGLPAKAAEAKSAPADEDPGFFDRISPKERLYNAGTAVNSAIDTAFFGVPSMVARAIGDPGGINKGIEGYRAANPNLSAITDTGGMMAPGSAVEGTARLAERALPAVENRVARIAKTALASGVTSGVTSGAESLSHGHSLRDAGEAAAQGAGAGLAVGAGAATVGHGLGKLGEAVLNSRGGKARTLIESRGKGAEVGLLSPGFGGVFDNELAGVTSDAAGEGEAAMRGSRGLLDQHEQDWSDKTGNAPEDYRRSTSDYARQVKGDVREAVGERPRKEPGRVLPQAEKLVGDIEEEHALSRQTYAGLKSQIDAKAAKLPPRDATELVMTMQDAANSMRTSPHSRSVLLDRLSALESKRDAHGSVSLSEAELNDLRGDLMRESKIGKTDVRGEAEAPLRAAAFKAREMVNEGPYAGLNDFYTKQSAENTARRQGAGLRKYPPKDRVVDVERAARRMASSEHANALGEHQRRVAHGNDETAAYVQDFESGKNRARKPRVQLGLSEDIPSRRAVDEERLKLRLLDRGKDTNTAGGKTDFGEYVADHPGAQGLIDLPELARARNRLSFGLSPHGGDLLSIARLGTVHGKLRLAALNASPVAGRVLYPGGLASKLAEPSFDRLSPLFSAALAAQERK